MFNLFKKHKKDKEVEDSDIIVIDKPQDANKKIYVGMYCEACGYMEVDESSSALPLEGFAVCSNCGALLKKGYFYKSSDGGFSLANNAANIIAKETKKIQSGGHYRVRKAGPNRGMYHGHFCNY